MFRCKDCAQAEEVVYVITSGVEHQIKLNPEMTKFVEVVRSGDEPDITTEEDAKAFFEAIDKEDILECPKCKESASKEVWVESFVDPLKYHESENLCHCGGELWMDNIPYTKSYGFVCDDCSWVKPNAVVRGD